MVWLVLLAALTVALVIVWRRVATPSQKPCTEKGVIPMMPRPCWPLVGHMPSILTWPENSHLSIHEGLFKELGAYSYIIYAPGIPLRTIILTVDPEVVKHITSTRFGTVYEKGRELQVQQRDFLGEGIFNVNGEEWQRHRKMISPLFHVTALREQVPVFERNAQQLWERLRVEWARPGVAERGMDMQDFCMRFTLDSFAEIGFGVQLHSIDQERNEFAVALDVVQTVTQHRGRKGNLWPLLETIRPETNFYNKLEYLNQLVESIIQQRMGQDEETLRASSDALSRVLVESMDRESPYTLSELRDFVMNFMLAGRDTTAALITWTLYYLAQHPEVEDKIEKELQDTLGDAPLTFENLKRLKYMKQVLQETLRLKPPVPVDGYSAMQDDVLPGGHVVKKGTEIYYLSEIMHRIPEFFEDPEAFRPERFERTPNGCREEWQQSAAYIPFHYGPRTCLGKEMAYEEAKIFFCSMFREGFRFRLREGFTPQLKDAIILTSANGMPMDLVSN